MARQDVKVDIRGPVGHREQITVFADPDEPTEVRSEVRIHLEGKGWDRGLLPEFSLSWLRGWSRSEVRAA